MIFRKIYDTFSCFFTLHGFEFVLVYIFSNVRSFIDDDSRFMIYYFLRNIKAYFQEIYIELFGYFLSTQVILIARDLTYISVVRFGRFSSIGFHGQEY